MAYIDKERFAEEICAFSAIDEHSANAVITLLHGQPTADVTEVKHIEWLPSPDGINPIRCKECNTPAPFLCGDDDFGNEVIARYPFKYCPYCGAKMDGKPKEGGAE